MSGIYKVRRYRLPSPLIGERVEEGMIEDDSGEWVYWEDYLAVLKHAASLTKPDSQVRYYLAHMFGLERIRQFVDVEDCPVCPECGIVNGHKLNCGYEENEQRKKFTEDSPVKPVLDAYRTFNLLRSIEIKPGSLVALVVELVNWAQGIEKHRKKINKRMQALEKTSRG